MIFLLKLEGSNEWMNVREDGQSHGTSQAFEKPGQAQAQAQATWPPNLSFVSPNPVPANRPSPGFWRA